MAETYDKLLHAAVADSPLPYLVMPGSLLSRVVVRGNSVEVVAPGEKRPWLFAHGGASIEFTAASDGVPASITNDEVEVSTQAELDTAIAAGHTPVCVGGVLAIDVKDDECPRIIVAGADVAVEARGSSKPCIETRGSSKPNIAAFDESQPHIETHNQSQPHILAHSKSQPHICARDESSPKIFALDSSRPHVEAFNNSLPEITTRYKAKTEIAAWHSSWPLEMEPEAP